MQIWINSEDIATLSEVRRDDTHMQSNCTVPFPIYTSASQLSNQNRVQEDVLKYFVRQPIVYTVFLIKTSGRKNEDAG